MPIKLGRPTQNTPIQGETGGQWLKRALANMGQRKGWLAEQLGMTPQNLSSLLGDRSPIHRKYVKILSDIFNVDEERIYRFTSEAARRQTVQLSEIVADPRLFNDLIGYEFDAEAMGYYRGSLQFLANDIEQRRLLFERVKKSRIRKAKRAEKQELTDDNDQSEADESESGDSDKGQSVDS